MEGISWLDLQLILVDLPYFEQSGNKESGNKEPAGKTMGTTKVKSFKHFLEVMKGISEKNLQNHE